LGARAFDRQSKEETMRPTTAKSENVFDFNALLYPGTVYDHPKDVVTDENLSLSEKRAILASWASDAAAVASCPALRSPQELKQPVAIDDIFDALRTLDGEPPKPPHHPPGGKPNRLRSISRLLAA